MPVSIKQSGVTLVELMVAIAVLAILVALAGPSFADFAERSALRGAADSMVSAVGAAKEEAIKRDRMVRVDFMALGSSVCMGAQTVAAVADEGCDCSSDVCDVVQFPERERDIRRVTLDGTPNFGGESGFVIDPRTGMLEGLTNNGALTMATSKGYQVRVNVNVAGRVSLCTPGTKGLPGVAPCG